MKKITILALHLNYGGVEKYISSLCKMLEDTYEIELVVTYKCNPAFEFSNKINSELIITNSNNVISFNKENERYSLDFINNFLENYPYAIEIYDYYRE